MGGMLANRHSLALVQGAGTATQLPSPVLRPAAANANVNRPNAGGAKQVKLDVITWWKKEAQVDWARVSPSERQQWRDSRWDMIETQVVDTIHPNLPSSSLCAPSLLALHASKMTKKIMHARRRKLTCRGGSSILCRPKRSTLPWRISSAFVATPLHPRPAFSKNLSRLISSPGPVALSLAHPAPSGVHVPAPSLLVLGSI